MFQIIKKIKINRLENNSALVFERIKQIISEKESQLREELNDKTYSPEAIKEIEEAIKNLTEPLDVELQFIKLKQKYCNNIDTMQGLAKNWNDYINAILEIHTLNSQSNMGKVDESSFVEIAKPLLQTRADVLKKFSILLEE